MLSAKYYIMLGKSTFETFWDKNNLTDKRDEKKITSYKQFVLRFIRESSMTKINLWKIAIIFTK